MLIARIFFFRFGDSSSGLQCHGNAYQLVPVVSGSVVQNLCFLTKIWGLFVRSCG